MSIFMNRLKQNKCPGCSSSLKLSILDDLYRCINSDCTFSITTDAFARFTKGLYTPVGRFRKGDEDNMSALNNHGHKVMSKDYSDVKVRK